MHSETDRTLALAGLYQCIALVRSIAEKGEVGSEELEHTLAPVMKIDADDVSAIYGSPNHLKRGLETLMTLKMPASRLSSVYAGQILTLEKRVSADRDMLNRIGAGIERAREQVDYFNSLVHESVIASLAETYKTTVSTLTPRVRVQGEPRFLENAANADKVRALLLSGLRSAVLWRQTGGTRWKLVLGQHKLLREVTALWQQTDGYHLDRQD
ncbi:MAG: high frequency lysogenization protein HflD [Gammaproteobacteria bacterium]